MTSRNLTPPKGILFDLGDTIILEEYSASIAGTERVIALAENPDMISAEEVRALADEVFADLVPRRESSWMETPPYQFFRLVYEPLGLTFSHSYEDLEIEYWKHATRFQTAPGIREVLDVLRGLAIPVGVVSNSIFSANTLSWELASRDLLSYFMFVMSSTEYGLRKPHPLFLQTAAKNIGLNPKDLWYAGNSVIYDVQGAHNAGMTAIWYNRTQEVSEGIKPHAEVHHWDEFLALVRQFY